MTHISELSESTKRQNALASLEKLGDFDLNDYTPAFAFRWAWMHFYGTATDRYYRNRYMRETRQTPDHCKALPIATMFMKYARQNERGYVTAMSNRHTVHIVHPDGGCALCGSLAIAGQSFGFLPNDCKGCERKYKALYNWARGMTDL